HRPSGTGNQRHQRNGQSQRAQPKNSPHSTLPVSAESAAFAFQQPCRTLPHDDGTRNRSRVLARKESRNCARRRTSGWHRVRGDGTSQFPLRAALGRRFAATAGGLPGVFWTIWLGLIVNRLASFVIAFLSIYLVRERGFSAAEAGKVLALYGAGM